MNEQEKKKTIDSIIAQKRNKSRESENLGIKEEKINQSIRDSRHVPDENNKMKDSVAYRA